MIRYAKYGAISYDLNSAICCVKSFTIGWCGSVETVNKAWYSYVPYIIVITEPYRSVLNRTVSYRIVLFRTVFTVLTVLYRALLTIPVSHCTYCYVSHLIALLLVYRITPNSTIDISTYLPYPITPYSPNCVAPVCSVIT